MPAVQSPVVDFGTAPAATAVQAPAALASAALAESGSELRLAAAFGTPLAAGEAPEAASAVGTLRSKRNVAAGSPTTDPSPTLCSLGTQGSRREVAVGGPDGYSVPALCSAGPQRSKREVVVGSPAADPVTCSAAASASETQGPQGADGSRWTWGTPALALVGNPEGCGALLAAEAQTSPVRLSRSVSAAGGCSASLEIPVTDEASGAVKPKSRGASTQAPAAGDAPGSGFAAAACGDAADGRPGESQAVPEALFKTLGSYSNLHPCMPSSSGGRWAQRPRSATRPGSAGTGLGPAGFTEGRGPRRLNSAPANWADLASELPGGAWSPPGPRPRWPKDGPVPPPGERGHWESPGGILQWVPWGVAPWQVCHTLGTI